MTNVFGGTRRRVVAAFAAAALTMVACSGTNLADQAEEMATKQCECVDFDCTLEQTQWFNRMRITQEDDINALSEADQARYNAASSRSADCQNALR